MANRATATHRRNTKGMNGTKGIGGRSRRSSAVHARCDRAVERRTRREGRKACKAGLDA